MAVLYSNNFETPSLHLQASADFTISTGSAFRVFHSAGADIGSYPEVTFVQGVRSYGTRDNDSNFCNLIADRADSGMRTAQSYRAGQCIGSWHRATVGQDRGILCFFDNSGGFIRARIVVRDSGVQDSAASGYDLAVVTGDVIHMESLVVGTLISLRIWKNAESRPATATVTLTSSLWTTGRVGLRMEGSQGGFRTLDNLVITDGAGGEDFFYPTFNFTGSVALDAVGTAGTFQGVAAGAFAGAITLDGVGVAGSFGASSGTLTSEPLRTNLGMLLASTALAHVAIYNDTTGALVLRRTSISTDTSGVFTITDPAIVAGVTYRIDWETAAGHRRMPRKLAA